MTHRTDHRRSSRNNRISRATRAWYAAYGGQNASAARQACARSSPVSSRARTGMSRPRQLTSASGFLSRLPVQAGCPGRPKLLPISSHPPP